RLVHLAARFDDELEWLRQGVKSASQWIADRLQIRSATAREWIRVGHALRHLPLIDAALAAGEISYAKARILTRWADVDSEAQLLGLARERTADRLSVAIARALADGGETDDERDARLHEARSVTTWTDGDGMTVVRVVVPPSVGKPIVAAIDELVRRIAALPPEGPVDAPTVPDGAPAGAVCEQKVVDEVTESGQNAPAGATGRQSVSAPPPKVSRQMSAPTDSLVDTLHKIGLRWHPSGHDEWTFPSLAQQRADALVVLLLGAGVQVSTEVVFHVRGDGATFDDGTPTTDSAIFRQLDQAFVRLLIHDADRRPVNASSARRLPT
ncbi:MAG: DUF222 domain-containing protein, partial [Acidimicrobiales bacterium]|nr:DUF222 domain-containing protein [Acidimicrobiales bacterium]